MQPSHRTYQLAQRFGLLRLSIPCFNVSDFVGLHFKPSGQRPLIYVKVAQLTWF